MASRLLSDRIKNGDEDVPQNYIFPSGRRPRRVPSRGIPIIDLANADVYTHRDSHRRLVMQLMVAAEEYGIFEVVNHGVPSRLMSETRSVLKEFFNLPAEEKARYYSMDLNKKFILYTSGIEYDKEALHHWRDATRHSCTPIDACISHWPDKPLRYREVVDEYVTKQKILGSRLLNLFCEGLGLEEGWFERELAKEPNLTVNHYPACPDPSLTWGSGEHYDPGLMTILLQDEVPGLQVRHNGTWIAIEPNLDKFLVNIGNLFEIVSNGRLKSVLHRVVTDSIRPRTTAAFFMEPNKQCLVRPATELLSLVSPPMCRPIRFGEMLQVIRLSFKGEMDCAMEAFMESLKV